MKTIVALFGFLSCIGGSLLAQDAKGGQTLVETQSPAKPEKKAVVSPPKKPGDEILGKRVVYGGYFTDLTQAEKKRALFNLKAPLDPQKDLENLWYYPGTERVQGVVLFSVKF